MSSGGGEGRGKGAEGKKDEKGKCSKAGKREREEMKVKRKEDIHGGRKEVVR